MDAADRRLSSFADAAISFLDARCITERPAVAILLVKGLDRPPVLLAGLEDEQSAKGTAVPTFDVGRMLTL